MRGAIPRSSDTNRDRHVRFSDRRIYSATTQRHVLRGYTPLDGTAAFHGIGCLLANQFLNLVAFEAERGLPTYRPVPPSIIPANSNIPCYISRGDADADAAPGCLGRARLEVGLEEVHLHLPLPALPLLWRLPLPSASALSTNKEHALTLFGACFCVSAMRRPSSRSAWSISPSLSLFPPSAVAGTQPVVCPLSSARTATPASCFVSGSGPA